MSGGGRITLSSPLCVFWNMACLFLFHAGVWEGTGFNVGGGGGGVGGGLGGLGGCGGVGVASCYLPEQG